MLVLGNLAFDIFASVRRLEEEELGSRNSHLKVYTERVITWSIFSLVIGWIRKPSNPSYLDSLTTPATFLENRTLERDFEESIDLVRRMDDSFNLATHIELTGFRLSKYMNQ